MDYQIKQLKPDDIEQMHGLLDCFGEAFEEVETYGSARPDAAYLRGLLAGETFIALIAEKDGLVVGGIAAYELRKFEQARSEIYLYDLAVAEAHRRKGIASALIAALQEVAQERGAWVVYVQADLGDDPAIALYSKLGTREEVLHFDLTLEQKRKADR